jgi:hypothetical protein
MWSEQCEDERARTRAEANGGGLEVIYSVYKNILRF